MRHPRHNSGLSLIEVMVSMAVGSIVLVAAFELVSGHSLLLGKTSSQVDMYQQSRLGVELLTWDLHMAGAGVGYRSDSSFAGVLRDNFSVNGGATFSGNDRPISLDTGAQVTDDIGMLRALGRARTVARQFSNFVEVCTGSELEANDLALLVSREGIFARSVVVTGNTPVGCSDGFCLGGCERITFNDDTSYESDNSALAADYTEGELVGELEQIVWFVTPAANGIGTLRRAQITPDRPCAVADATCGGMVASGIESLQLRVMQWDEVTSTWEDVTAGPSIADRRRVRFDVEVVARGKPDQRGSMQDAVTVDIAGACAPAPCGSTDSIPRTVIRTSVEVRNSGRHQLN